MAPQAACLLGLLGAALLGAAASGARAAPPVDAAASLRVLDECLASVGAVGAAPAPAPADAHAVPLLQRCPRLAAVIGELSLGAQLPSHWRTDLDPDSLAALARLEHRYLAAAPSAAPSLSTLPAVLRSLQAPAMPLSWWQRWRDRVRRWLQGSGDPDAAWLGDWLSRLSIPRLLQQLLFYATTAAVLALAGWTVLQELRAAGVLGATRASRTELAPLAAGAPPVDAAALDPLDVERAPATQRGVLLMRLLVQALRHTGRLSGERALTYRELAALPLFAEALQRERFTRVALLAEQQRYGTSPTPELASEVLADGRLLYRQLLQP